MCSKNKRTHEELNAGNEILYDFVCKSEATTDFQTPVIKMEQRENWRKDYANVEICWDSELADNFENIANLKSEELNEVHVKVEENLEIPQEKLEIQSQVYPQLDSTESITDTEVGTSENRAQNCNDKSLVQCEICHEVFSDGRHLRNHYRTGLEKKFEFETRHVKFRWEPNLINHKDQHTGNRPLECEQCHKKFICKAAYQKHLSLAQCEKRLSFECDICHEIFFKRGYLRSHSLTHMKSRPYKCGLCPAQFKIKQSLQRHLMAHSSEKPFQCKICHQRFGWESALNRHKLKHPNVGSYMCGICDAKFIRKRNFNLHQTMHNTNALKCVECGQEFPMKWKLQKHMTKHIAEKPYKCGICHKTFKTKYIIQAHQLTHGDRPFECDVCGGRFYSKSRLLYHKKTHIRRESFECEFCNVMFRHKSSLVKHRVKHHEAFFAKQDSK